jgi:PIN domain nuclease of toxin-antitoxin system
LWWLTKNPRLSASAFAAIGDSHNEVRMSAVSPWELAIKMSMGKLPDIVDLQPRLVGAAARAAAS